MTHNINFQNQNSNITCQSAFHQKALPIERLPEDILTKILSYLPSQDLTQLAYTNRTLLNRVIIDTKYNQVASINRFISAIIEKLNPVSDAVTINGLKKLLKEIKITNFKNLKAIGNYSLSIQEKLIDELITLDYPSLNAFIKLQPEEVKPLESLQNELAI